MICALAELGTKAVVSRLFGRFPAMYEKRGGSCIVTLISLTFSIPAVLFGDEDRFGDEWGEDPLYKVAGDESTDLPRMDFIIDEL